MVQYITGPCWDAAKVTSVFNCFDGCLQQAIYTKSLLKQIVNCTAALSSRDCLVTSTNCQLPWTVLGLQLKNNEALIDSARSVNFVSKTEPTAFPAGFGSASCGCGCRGGCTVSSSRRQLRALPAPCGILAVRCLHPDNVAPCGSFWLLVCYHFAARHGWLSIAERGVQAPLHVTSVCLPGS